MTVLARHGKASAESSLEAYRAGMKRLDMDIAMPVVEDWVSTMDNALERLDRLKAEDKKHLTEALIEVVASDGRVEANELELLRVSCSLIHVPMPMITASRQISPQS
jgi:hypothetical protein